MLKTSSRLLLYHVEDVIGLAQIKSGKFTKILEEFDVKSAVEDIMSIQNLSAQQKKVSMTCQFFNFPRNNDATVKYSVYSDLKRFQQVLLNLQSNSLKFSISGDSIWIKVYFVPRNQTGHRILKDSYVDNFFSCERDLLQEDIMFILQNDQEYRTMFRPGEKDKLVVSVLDSGVGIQLKD